MFFSASRTISQVRGLIRSYIYSIDQKGNFVLAIHLLRPYLSVELQRGNILVIISKEGRTKSAMFLIWV